MDSLYQRLKELDPDTFQRLCFQLLKERHPEQDIRHVEGASGDKGLDVFAGELYGKPAIWQCKAFPNGVGKSQKQQIRESLRTALKNFSPAHWILCLTVDLDEKASRWFEKLKTSNAGRVNIGKMFASDIVNELLHRRTLKNHFFPNASLDVMELKRLAARTGEMTTQELDALTDINLEDTIEHWKDRDARFNYQIVFDGDSGPPNLRPASIQPGLVMTIYKPGGKTVNVFERDAESLRADPPTFTTIFTGSGIDKFEQLVKTGAPQEFDTHELGPITSKWPLMRDVTNAGNTYKLSVGPSPLLLNRKRSVRVDFVNENAAEQVRYPQMIAFGFDVGVGHLIVEKLRGLRLAGNTPVVIIQQAAEKRELALPIQDLDLHEICELPSECLHVLVEPFKIVLDMRPQQLLHAVIGELRFEFGNCTLWIAKQAS
jgi:hypothetical protein